MSEEREERDNPPLPGASPLVGRRGLSAERLEKAISVARERLGESLTVADLARSVGLSEFHFSRRFRISTGTSPHAWLMHARLERAKELLVSTSLPLREVARAVGYGTHAHFSSTFRKAVGMSPSRYRAQHTVGQA